MPTADATRPRPVVLVLDARTGQAMHQFDQLEGALRWLRLSGVDPSLEPQRASAVRPTLLVGLSSSVVALDPVQGRSNWTIAGVPAASSIEAWAVDDRLYVLDASRSLWQVPIASGQVPPRPLETMEHLVASTLVEATPLPGGRMAFSTEHGVCVFDRSGELVAIDGIVSQDAAAVQGQVIGLVPPLPAHEAFVALESAQRVGSDGFQLHILDGATATLRSTRLLMGLPMVPRRVAIIDERIIVTVGSGSIVYAAPLSER